MIKITATFLWKRNESGNALIFVLVGVALFAALSFTVANSMRSENTNRLSAQEATLAASEIMAYAQKIEREVDRMRRNGISESEIDFGSTQLSRWNASPPLPWASNPNCTNNDCRIFRSTGGTLPDTVFEQYANQNWGAAFSSNHPFPGHPAFYRISAIGVGTDAEDLILKIMNLEDSVCNAINASLNLPEASEMTEEVFGSHGVTARSSVIGYWDLENALSAEPLFDEATPLQGHTHGCVNIDFYSNTYFHVLIAR